MNQLTAIEADRVVAILDETIEKLDMVSRIQADVDGTLVNRLNNQGLDSVSHVLSNQWKIEHDFHRFWANSNRSSTDLTAGNDTEINDRITANIKRVCREINNNPSSKDIILGTFKRATPPNREVAAFVEYLQSLKGVTLRRLRTTVEEDMANKNLLYELTEREREMSENKNMLVEQLEKERGEKEQEEAELEQQLLSLETELRTVTQANQSSSDQLEQELQETLATSLTSHEEKMKRLQDRVAGLEKQWREERDRNSELEHKKRKEKSKLESNLKEFLEAYDSTMLGMQNELDMIESKCEEEEAEFDRLKARFDLIDENLGRRAEEERILRAVRERNEAARGRLHTVATRVQAILRGKNVRMEMAKQQKGKKKGKKGT